MNRLFLEFSLAIRVILERYRSINSIYIALYILSFLLITIIL